jgi:glycosyltransferase involved in cell wall biosynthesis
VKLSIITPSYNQGRFIERTLQSALSQNVAHSEYVVFDGGSTDGTLEILKRYGDRVRWVSRKDRGQADAVNQGIRATSGEIIGWINSDDVYRPGAIEAALAFLSANPSVDVVYGDAFHIREDDTIIEPYPTEDWDFDRFKSACFICQPAAFFRRSVTLRFGLLDESLQYCMDYEYWLRLAAGGARFARLRQPLAGSRLHPETKTLGSRNRVVLEINDMMRRTLGRVPDRWLINYAYAVVERTGIERSSHRVLSTLLAGAVALLAALRWNRSISQDMLSRVPAAVKRWWRQGK